MEHGFESLGVALLCGQAALPHKSRSESGAAQNGSGPVRKRLSFSYTNSNKLL